MNRSGPWSNSTLALTQCKLVVLGVLAIHSAACAGPTPQSRAPARSFTAGGAAPSGSVSSAGSGVVSDPNKVLSKPAVPTGTAGNADKMGPQPVQSAPISREPLAIDACDAKNSAGLSADAVQKLKAGSGSPGALKWLYPYAGTIFPRGMLAPDLMWDGPAAEAVYVHVKSRIFEYWACLRPLEPGRITLAQDVWENAGQRSYGRDDDYLIELSVLSGGVVTGPIQNHVQIAQAALKGSIYYNTYRSALANSGAFAGIPGVNGIVVRIPSGGRAEPFSTTDCNGCHSVSADGSLLLAQGAFGGAMRFELVANGPAPMPTMAGINGSWTALYPDGAFALSMSTATMVARAGAFGALAGNTVAQLFDTKTSQPVASTGIPPGTLMPFFSPDGTFLVFNDYAVEQAHGIVLARYDTKVHTATDLTVLYKEPPGPMRPGWPFVLPDNKGVIFVRTESADFTGDGAGVSNNMRGSRGGPPPYSELSVVDVASKNTTVLARAMGYNTPEDAAKGLTYLPFGHEDIHHAYYPTVSPVGSGGYFWVFFDSLRHYGNLGLQRQLWGAAVDISPDGTYTRDPSHPAFYLTGQEFGTGNHRAFAALDPCRKDGDRCNSGIDCCGGFCYADGQAELVETVGTCSPQRMTCSRRDERCRLDADCCPAPAGQPPYSCIGGFCALVMGPS